MEPRHAVLLTSFSTSGLSYFRLYAGFIRCRFCTLGEHALLHSITLACLSMRPGLIPNRCGDRGCVPLHLVNYCVKPSINSRSYHYSIICQGRRVARPLRGLSAFENCAELAGTGTKKPPLLCESRGGGFSVAAIGGGYIENYYTTFSYSRNTDSATIIKDLSRIKQSNKR